MTKRTKNDKRTPKARRASAAFGRIMREKAAQNTAAMTAITALSQTFTPKPILERHEATEGKNES